MKLTPRQILALKARVDLVTFNRCVYPPYMHAPHLQLISDALMQVERYIATQGREGIGKLRVELAPRHGKSQLVARLFPAWLLGRLPDARIILASHTASLSEGHSRFVRNTLKSPTYQSIFARTRLSDDSQARDSWDLAEPNQGGLFAIGVGGAVHGRGGQCLIADDLIASREAYESKSQRDKLWAWFTDDLGSRAEPHAAKISISTRWGVDDPQGRLEVNEPGEWTVIKLPALAEENDPLGRQPGQALWPARFDKPALEAQRRSMGEYSFQALYQQNPVAASGNVFRRDKLQKLIDTAPTNTRRKARFWDTALSEKTTADYTVGVLMAETDDGRYIVLNVQRWQASWHDSKDRIVRTALQDGPDVRIGVEAVTFASLAVQELLEIPELHSFSIKGYPVHKDKLTRALPFAARTDADMVSLYRGSWLYDYVDELCAFQSGKNDDQVDATSGAYSMLADEVADMEISENPFWGEPESFYSTPEYIASLPRQVGIECLPVAHLTQSLAWPEGWKYLKAVLDYSTAAKPTVFMTPLIQFIRADTGAVYALCQHCEKPTSDLYPARNLNLICPDCFKEDV